MPSLPFSKRLVIRTPMTKAEVLHAVEEGAADCGLHGNVHPDGFELVHATSGAVVRGKVRGLERGCELVVRTRFDEYAVLLSGIGLMTALGTGVLAAVGLSAGALAVMAIGTLAGATPGVSYVQESHEIIRWLRTTVPERPELPPAGPFRTG